MPKTTVYFYQNEEGEVPLFQWLDTIKDKKAIKKCFAAIKTLKDFGHELRRPQADYLRDGVYELRVSLRGIQYRMLYFFHGKNVAVVAHGLVKEQKVPPKEIDLAIERKKKYEAAPQKHTFFKRGKNETD